jgi:hypothetical protein
VNPSCGAEAIPDVPAEQRQVTDLVKRIRKLRWFGFEQAAAELQLALSRAQPAEKAIVLKPRSNLSHEGNQ